MLSTAKEDRAGVYGLRKGHNALRAMREESLAVKPVEYRKSEKGGKISKQPTGVD